MKLIKVKCKDSQLSKAIYDPIEFALVDLLSGDYTTGGAMQLVRQMEQQVEKSKKLFEKEDYEGAKREIEPVGKNIQQFSVFGGSWKKWGGIPAGWEKVYTQYYQRLMKAFLDLRKEINDYIAIKNRSYGGL